MREFLSDSPKYVHIWKKYRPAILRLMIESEKEPQKYQLSKHEFVDAHPKQKGGYSFTLRAFKGRAVNNIKDSVLSEELLVILNRSGKATELIDDSTYEFMMDKSFMLHVSKEVEKVEEKSCETLVE